MKNKLASALFIVALFLLILTVSIGLPIYVRPFFYAHIDALALPEQSGFTREEIIEAYDEVLDYLTIPGKPFGTGVMPHSEEGASHFADCKILFDLNGTVLILSFVSIFILLVLRKKNKIKLLGFGRFSAGICSALAATLIPLILGGLAAIDFDRAFDIFHAIFFPGKVNFIFYPDEDPIIRILPVTFFRNCGILICAGILTFSLSIIIAEWIRLRRKCKH